MPAAVRIPMSSRIWYIVPERQYGDLVRVESMKPDGNMTHLFVQRSMITELGRVRNTDPDTSVEAANRQNVDKIRTEHQVVLQLLQWESLTDFELAKRASQALGRPVKQTSIGVRRGELVRLGLVVDSGRKGVSDTGSRCIIWQITNAGREAVAR